MCIYVLLLIQWRHVDRHLYWYWSMSPINKICYKVHYFSIFIHWLNNFTCEYWDILQQLNGEHGGVQVFQPGQVSEQQNINLYSYTINKINSDAQNLKLATVPFLNPFVTTGQYTDTLFQLETVALSIQIHVMTDKVLIYWHIGTRPSGFKRMRCQNFVLSSICL